MMNLVLFFFFLLGKVSSTKNSRKEVSKDSHILDSEETSSISRSFKSVMQASHVSLNQDRSSHSENAVVLSPWLARYLHFMKATDVIPPAQPISLQFKPKTIRISITNKHYKEPILIELEELKTLDRLCQMEIIIYHTLLPKDMLMNDWNLMITFAVPTPQVTDILVNLIPRRNSPEAIREGYKALYARLSNSLKSPDPVEDLEFILFYEDIFRSNDKDAIMQIIEDFLYINRAQLDSLSIQPVVQWFFYLALRKFLKIVPTSVAHIDPSQVLTVFEKVSKYELIPRVIDMFEPGGLFDMASEKTKCIIMKRLHKNRFYRHPKLALICLERFAPMLKAGNSTETNRNLLYQYPSSWIKSDILDMIIKFDPPRKDFYQTLTLFLQTLVERCPNDWDPSWVAAYLNRIVDHPITGDCVDWSMNGPFVVYLIKLWKAFPVYFENYEAWDYILDKAKLKLSKETTKGCHVCLYFGPLLSMKRPGIDSTTLISWFTTRFTSYGMLMSVIDPKNFMFKFSFALELFLFYTNFVDPLVELQRRYPVEAWRPRTVEIHSKGVTDVARVIVFAQSELYKLHNAFNMQRFDELGFQNSGKRDFTTILIESLVARLAEAGLRRQACLAIWTLEWFVASEAFLEAVIRKDFLVFTFLYITLGLDSAVEERERLFKNLKPRLDNYLPAQVLLDVLTDCGSERLDPCRPRLRSPFDCQMDTDIRRPSNLIYTPPPNLWRLENPDASIPILRVILLMIFGIELDFTRSDAQQVLLDRWVPEEFEIFLNFWIERWCACKGRETAWKLQLSR